MTATSPATQTDATDLVEQPAPACVMSFNVSDPSGAGGIAGDVSTIAAMGAHALPIVTSIMMRDTAEIFGHHPIDADAIVEQARNVLEDVTIAAWKVGFLGSTEGVSAVAEILSDLSRRAPRGLPAEPRVGRGRRPSRPTSRPSAISSCRRRKC